MTWLRAAFRAQGRGLALPISLVQLEVPMSRAVLARFVAGQSQAASAEAAAALVEDALEGGGRFVDWSYVVNYVANFNSTVTEARCDGAAAPLVAARVAGLPFWALSGDALLLPEELAWPAPPFDILITGQSTQERAAVAAVASLDPPVNGSSGELYRQRLSLRRRAADALHGRPIAADPASLATPPSAAGEGWRCPAAWFGDGVCNCECGGVDIDCVCSGCTAVAETGCEGEGADGPFCSPRGRCAERPAARTLQVSEACAAGTLRLPGETVLVGLQGDAREYAGACPACPGDEIFGGAAQRVGPREVVLFPAPRPPARPRTPPCRPPCWLAAARPPQIRDPSARSRAARRGVDPDVLAACVREPCGRRQRGARRARRGRARRLLCAPARRRALPPPPPSRTKWTRRVPHPVLIGHAACLTGALPVAARGWRPQGGGAHRRALARAGGGARGRSCWELRFFRTPGLSPPRPPLRVPNTKHQTPNTKHTSSADQGSPTPPPSRAAPPARAPAARARRPLSRTPPAPGAGPRAAQRHGRRGRDAARPRRAPRSLAALRAAGRRGARGQLLARAGGGARPPRRPLFLLPPGPAPPPQSPRLCTRSLRPKPRGESPRRRPRAPNPHPGGHPSGPRPAPPAPPAPARPAPRPPHLSALRAQVVLPRGVETSHELAFRQARPASRPKRLIILLRRIPPSDAACPISTG